MSAVYGWSKAAMHWGREARLDGLVQRFTYVDEAERERRETLRTRVAVGAFLRWALEQLGVDPASAVNLRVADEAAAELTALGEPADPPPYQEQALPDREPGLDDDTVRLVARYRDGTLSTPDPARASLAELFAWCIARLEDAATFVELEARSQPRSRA